MIIGGGNTLQPVLYALAAERLLGEPVESGRLYYCTSRGSYEERVVEIDDAARAAARDFVATVAARSSDGFLPAAPGRRANATGATTGWCAGRTRSCGCASSRLRAWPRSSDCASCAKRSGKLSMSAGA